MAFLGYLQPLAFNGHFQYHTRRKIGRFFPPDRGLLVGLLRFGFFQYLLRPPIGSHFPEGRDPQCLLVQGQIVQELEIGFLWDGLIPIRTLNGVDHQHRPGSRRQVLIHPVFIGLIGIGRHGDLAGNVEPIRVHVRGQVSVSASPTRYEVVRFHPFSQAGRNFNERIGEGHDGHSEVFLKFGFGLFHFILFILGFQLRGVPVGHGMVPDFLSLRRDILPFFAPF